MSEPQCRWGAQQTCEPSCEFYVDVQNCPADCSCDGSSCGWADCGQVQDFESCFAVTGCRWTGEVCEEGCEFYDEAACPQAMGCYWNGDYCSAF